MALLLAGMLAACSSGSEATREHCPKGARCATTSTTLATVGAEASAYAACQRSAEAQLPVDAKLSTKWAELNSGVVQVTRHGDGYVVRTTLAAAVGLVRMGWTIDCKARAGHGGRWLATVRLGRPRPQSTGGASAASASALAAGQWSTIPAAPIDARDGASLIWTGREMLVWGGASLVDLLRNDGAAYDPSTGRWRKLPYSPLTARTGQTAVWTGHEMLIWGGRRGGDLGHQVLADGAAYNPTTNRWRPLPRSPLSGRSNAIAVWTDTSAMILGGDGVNQDPFRSFPDGAVYNPIKNTWRRIASPHSAHRRFAWRTATQAGPARLLASTSWVITHQTSDGYSARGGADLFSFDEARNRWSLEPSPKAGGVADPYEAVWTAQFAIFRGSPINCGPCSHPSVDGVTAIYTPRSRTWRRTAPDPLRTDGVLSVWTGHGLFSFNRGTSMQGGSIDIAPGDASTYDASTDAWERLPRSPGGCTNPSTPIWTGHSVLIYCPGSATPPPQTAGLILTPS